MSKSTNKNIFKLMAFSALLSGCVLPENKTVKEESVAKRPDGTEENIQITYGYKGYEYTLLGNVWNSATYSLLGAGYGVVDGWENAFNSTNDCSFATKVFDGAVGAFSGSAKYAKEGLIYGYEMSYDEGPSIERVLKEQIDKNIPKIIPFYNENER